jgi:cell division protein FtsI (penicillin-binding protein 3)
VRELGVAPPPSRPTAAPIQLHRWVRMRMVGVAAVITALLAAVAYRAYGLQIREAAHYRELAERQHIATVQVPAPRGAIYDATGAELAATANIDSVYANPQETHDLGGTAERLGRILGVPAGEIEARLSAPRFFVWIERHVSQDKARAVRAAHLEGVHLTPEPRRFYPGGALAGPVLGFSGIDGRGLDGVELTMNARLTGRRMSASALRDATGALMLPDGPVEPVPGASVMLTIDRFVQYTAERALADVVQTHRARAGVIVVIDVPSGGVLAMANWPTFDPNRPAGARDRAARDRAVTDVYEVGSVMKVFSVAAALDAGVVEPDTRFDVNGGVLRIGNTKFSDVHHDQVLTVSGVIKRSSNVGAAKIAQRLGRDALRAGLIRFGFGQKTGIELPGEEGGLVRAAKSWGPVELATISFGYGLSATPIQVAAGLAAIARGGIYRAPYIVREVRDGSGQVLSRHRPVDRRVISEKTALELRPMLASVFDRGKESGTAHEIVLPGFRAAAKTGTAYKINPATRHYDHHVYLSSFAGFAPLDDPRVAVLVMIDEPNGDEHFGSQVAGPPWLEVMVETLRYLGVGAGQSAAPSPSPSPSPAAAADPDPDPDPEPSVAVESEPGSGPGPETEPALESGSDSDAAVGEGAPVEGDDPVGTVDLPDLGGLGLAEALERAGARCGSVQVRGSGRVIEQFPPPGRQRRPAECRIVLSHETGPRPRSSR